MGQAVSQDCCKAHKSLLISWREGAVLVSTTILAADVYVPTLG